MSAYKVPSIRRSKGEVSIRRIKESERSYGDFDITTKVLDLIDDMSTQAARLVRSRVGSLTGRFWLAGLS
jgi:hypothetical protein